MRHFLVHTTVALPDHDDPELAALRIAEVERAHQLQQDGVIVALWREAGRLASYGIWRGGSAEEVRAHIASLPMHRYMTLSITELHRHPNAVSAFPFADKESVQGE
ncbi:MAG: muconolactone Delta-isomerase family protein [Microbacteriaceae bacterium]|nr:muconolactone Delta-isomerase family protein [Microbacteriaceae bacterium]